MTNNTINLPPCSCGSTDASIGYESPQGYWVECGDCGHQTSKSHSRELAIAEWNTRAALADPVPPAGGELEVLAWLVRDSRDGQFSAHRSNPAGWANGYQITELVDRAHFTRLQADFDKRCDSILEELGCERDALQSELTEARGLLSDCKWRIVNKNTKTADYARLDKPVVAAIDAFLSRQSAPAAKDVCGTCNGTKMVEDGEITCSDGGTPFENGPVKCVKDCPECAPADQPAPVAAVLLERSPKDYAIEHAEYMAKSANDVLEKFQAYGLALLACDEGGDDGEGELFENIDSTRSDLQEALVGLRSMVYEFRKRSNRCTPQ